MADHDDPPDNLFALELAQRQLENIRAGCDELMGQLIDRCEGGPADPLLATALQLQMQTDLVVEDLDMHIRLARSARRNPLACGTPGLLGQAETAASRAAQADAAVRELALEAMSSPIFPDGPTGEQRIRFVGAARTALVCAEMAGRSAAQLYVDLEEIIHANEVTSATAQLDELRGRGAEPH